MNKGFLGTHAPFAADCVLALELAMGAALIAGAVLARRKCYRAHATCQTAVVLVNLVVIAGYMAPSFWRAVVPEIPDSLAGSYYWLATAHGILGIVAEALGIYILLVAGTNLPPKWLRFTRYKPWMRTCLALWWLELLLGIATYVRWYGAPKW